VPHEVGHLFGAGHDRFTCGPRAARAGCGALYNYSYGNRLQTEGITYRTVMSYDPGIVIPYFSNPNVLFRGVPTGIPEGATNSADNARTINQQAPVIANIMQATCRFEFATNAYDIDESAGSLLVEVLRTGATNVVGSVQCVTSGQTAVPGKDFIAKTNLVTFAAGEVRHSVSIQVLNNSLGDGDKTLVVSLRQPTTGMGLGPTDAAQVTIRDDQVHFQFASTNWVFPEGGGVASILVRRGGNTNVAASVDYATVDGSARAGKDFVTAAGTLAFGPGEIEKAIAVVPIQDTPVEPDVQFTVVLKNPSMGGLVPPGIASVTIADGQRPGSLDTSFPALQGLSDFACARVGFPDGRFLFAGRFQQGDGRVRTLLRRYWPDGSVDGQFVPAEFLTTLTPEPGLYPSYVSSLVVQPDGRILVAGQFGSVNGVFHSNLARLNQDGTLDSSFTAGTDAACGGRLHGALLLQPDGKILVWSGFLSVNGLSRPYLARLKSDGSLDSIFAPKPNPDTMSVSEVALQADGKLLVAGGFWGFEGKSEVYLARLKSDGTLDQAYRGAVNGTVNRILVLPDQRVLIGGAFTSPRNGLARLLPDGTLDSSFDPKSLFNAPILNFERLADGRIMVAGAFTAAGASKQNYLVRLQTDGSIDATFDSGLGPNDWTAILGIEPNGWIVIAGLFDSINGQPASFLARLRSDDPRPRFDAPILFTDGTIEIKLSGNAQSRYVLESSLDLSDWAPVWTNTLPGASLEWKDRAKPDAAPQFFRAHQLVP
jgi:uncharacterized delta-60 repeat protein